MTPSRYHGQQDTGLERTGCQSNVCATQHVTMWKLIIMTEKQSDLQTVSTVFSCE